MLELLNLVIFCWLAAWTIFAVRKIAYGARSSVLFLLVIHFIFFAVPLLLDVVVGVPDYSIAPGFRIATADVMTGVVYALYNAVIPPVLWMCGRPSSAATTGTASPMRIAFRTSIETVRSFKWLYFVLLALPLVIWFFSPDRELYYSYGAALLSKGDNDYHNFLALTCKLALIAYASMLYASRRLALHFLLTLPLPMTVLWLDGKRSSVAMFILLVNLVLWIRGTLRGRRLVAVALGSLVLVMAFSHYYQLYIRETFTQKTYDFAARYESVRIDYGRDHGMKLALYAELHPEMLQILEYRGQSVLFSLTMPVPRSVWPSKPWPYAVYMTSAMFLREVKEWGWGITTSWLEEAIANFGWLGMLIAPLSLAAMCRLGDTSGSEIGYALTILVASLFLCVQLSAFSPLFFIWVGVTAYGHLGGRQKKRTVIRVAVPTVSANVLLPTRGR